MKALVLFLSGVFTQLALAGTVYDGDFLMPCESAFDDPYASVDEWPEIRRALLDGHSYHAEAKFFCMPAFGGPYAWTIETTESGYVLRASRLSRSFTEIIGPATEVRIAEDESGKEIREHVELDRRFDAEHFQTDLNPELAHEIRDSWRSILERARYPTKDEIAGIGMDGADYYFSATSPDAGVLLAGTVWSPDEDRNPRVYLLVEAADAIFSIACGDREVDRQSLMQLLKELRTVSQSGSRE